MPPVNLGTILSEAAAVLREPSGSDTVDALRLAIYLEDALGIALPDDVLTADRLGSVDAVARVVTSHGGDD